MCGAMSPLPQYAFMVWFSLKNKHRDSFAFTFYMLQDLIDDLIILGTESGIFITVFRKARH
jgi:hypothetical protein